MLSAGSLKSIGLFAVTIGTICCERWHLTVTFNKALWVSDNNHIDISQKPDKSLLLNFNLNINYYSLLLRIKVLTIPSYYGTLTGFSPLHRYNYLLWSEC